MRLPWLGEGVVECAGAQQFIGEAKARQIYAKVGVSPDVYCVILAARQLTGSVNSHILGAFAFAGMTCTSASYARSSATRSTLRGTC